MSIEDIQQALIFDLITVVGCVALLVRYARLGMSHPGLIYIIFHLYAFSSRLATLSAGSDTMFTVEFMQFDPVTYAEIVRAATMADAAFVVFTMGCITASMADLGKAREVDQAKVTISTRHVWRVVSFSLPVGILGLLLFAKLPGQGDVATGDLVGTSSYFAILPAWAGLSLLCLIYLYGFNKYLMIPMTAYLLLMMFQGYHRFRVIIPCILLIQIYLERRGLKWPTYRMMALYLALAALFFPMKAIGSKLQAGATLDEIISLSTDSVGEAVSGNHGDAQFMDEFAMVLTLVDNHGSYFYGRPYLALLTLPIPRAFWPEKPTLSAHLKELSVPRRPIAEMGMITLYLGDLYLNFGSFGVYAGTFLIAYWSTSFYFIAYRYHYYSTVRFLFLVLSCHFLQIYRDGLLAVVLFLLVNMMPLMIILLLHYLSPYEAPATLKPGPA